MFSGEVAGDARAHVRAYVRTYARRVTTSVHFYDGQFVIVLSHIRHVNLAPNESMQYHDDANNSSLL